MNSTSTTKRPRRKAVPNHAVVYKTTLWVKEKGATFFRLMNTITPTSSFRNTRDHDLHLPERQWEAAVDIMEGWRMNGGMQSARFRIVQTLLNDDSAPKTRFFGPGSDVDNLNATEGTR